MEGDAPNLGLHKTVKEQKPHWSVIRHLVGCVNRYLFQDRLGKTPAGTVVHANTNYLLVPSKGEAGSGKLRYTLALGCHTPLGEFAKAFTNLSPSCAGLCPFLLFIV